jgi:hypothetical protein
MKLSRQSDGAITLEGVPIKRWFETHGYRPVTTKYLDGGCMCLLSAMGYAAAGHDPVKLEAAIQGRRQPPHWTTTVEQLAKLIGISYDQALELEFGWTCIRHGHPSKLWQLGADARSQSQ